MASASKIPPASSSSPETDDEDRLSDCARKLHRYIRKLKWTSLHETITLLCTHADDGIIRTALTQCNRHGESPLHAITKDAPDSLILLLLQLIPSGERKDYLLAMDNDGNTPLHCLCRCFDSFHADTVHTVHVMASMCPQAISMRNAAGDTPLHLFVTSCGYMECSNDCDDDVVHAMEMARLRLQRGAGPLGVYGT